jgi:glycosyltransferase involved in cell wall biosynthesis
VTVTGAVPDVRPWLAGAALAVAPFRLGRGLQNKILEAMASGVPVVGTTLAFQGLDDPRSAGIRVADNPAGLAREILALLADPALRQRCAREGRRYVERHHRWEDHHATLSRLLREVVGDSSARTAGTGAASR